MIVGFFSFRPCVKMSKSCFPWSLYQFRFHPGRVRDTPLDTLTSHLLLTLSTDIPTPIPYPYLAPPHPRSSPQTPSRAPEPLCIRSKLQDRFFQKHQCDQITKFTVFSQPTRTIVFSYENMGRCDQCNINNITQHENTFLTPYYSNTTVRLVTIPPK